MNFFLLLLLPSGATANFPPHLFSSISLSLGGNADIFQFSQVSRAAAAPSLHNSGANTNRLAKRIDERGDRLAGKVSAAASLGALLLTPALAASAETATAATAGHNNCAADLAPRCTRLQQSECLLRPDITRPRSIN